MHARCEIDDYTSRLGQLLHLLIYEIFIIFGESLMIIFDIIIIIIGVVSVAIIVFFFFLSCLGEFNWIWTQLVWYSRKEYVELYVI